jgi:hypothetical protein
MEPAETGATGEPHEALAYEEPRDTAGPNAYRHFDARGEGWTKVVLDGSR